MSYNRTSNPNRTIKKISYQEYCFNRVRKANTPFRIKGGIGCYVDNGVEISVEEMDRMFPTPICLSYNENTDGTKNWQYL